MTAEELAALIVVRLDALLGLLDDALSDAQRSSRRVAQLGSSTCSSVPDVEQASPGVVGTRSVQGVRP